MDEVVERSFQARMSVRAEVVAIGSQLIELAGHLNIESRSHLAVLG